MAFLVVFLLLYLYSENFVTKTNAPLANYFAPFYYYIYYEKKKKVKKLKDYTDMNALFFYYIIHILLVTCMYIL